VWKKNNVHRYNQQANYREPLQPALLEIYSTAREGEKSVGGRSHIHKYITEEKDSPPGMLLKNLFATFGEIVFMLRLKTTCVSNFGVCAALIPRDSDLATHTQRVLFLGLC